MSRDPCIAVVDNDRDLRGFGMRVRGFADGESFLREVAAGLRMDAAVLDLMLPGSDGLQVCQRLRLSSSVPVLMLTARGDLVDRVLGLQLGADDYLVKPFEPRELVARLRAMLRRAWSGAEGPVVAPGGPPRAARFGPWRLDFERRELAGSDGPVSLDGREYKLLRILLERPGRVVSRDALLDAIHGRAAGPYDRAVDLLVSRLRARLGDSAQEPRLIKTVRGEGCLLAAQVEFERCGSCCARCRRVCSGGLPRSCSARLRWWWPLPRCSSASSASACGATRAP
ncbi:MAG: response regulator transcription factor [Burkholderiales bacterium]|nr:response regulator transcription factor [Burkholderiales bacterium]